MQDTQSPADLHTHPLSDVIPWMRPAEWGVFLEDIKQRGILEPLQLAGDGCTVLDGRHRLKAAVVLGISAVPVKPASLQDVSETEYVVRAALVRRNLTDDQRAIIADRTTEKLIRERKQQASKRASAMRWGNPCEEIGAISSHPLPRTRQLLATTFGISQRRLMKAQFVSDQAPDLADEVLHGTLPLIQAVSLAKRRANLAALAQLPDLSPTDRLQVLCGDFREVGAGLPDGSIDLIVTDPPYTKADMPLWDDVAAFAKRMLKPSGFFVTYCGNLYLPEAIQSLGKHLTYYWLVCLEHRSAHPKNYFRHTFGLMKPILIYAKEPIIVQSEWLMDIVKDTGPDKRYHDWGQSVQAVRYLVSRFSKRGDLVLDMCAGSGTNVLAALLEGRRAIAIEINPLHATTIRKRGQEILAAATPNAS